MDRQGVGAFEAPPPLCVSIHAFMSPASTAVAVVAMIAEGVPLVRAVRQHFIKNYKFFFFYLGYVLVRDLCLFVFSSSLSPMAYLWFYWITELVAVLLGCGLVWEAYKIALAGYPGAARMARNVLLLMFVLTFAKILLDASQSPKWIPGRTPLDTDIDFRIVQVALLLSLVALFAYYAIPLGRNLKGIVYGYSFYVICALTVLLLLKSRNKSFQPVWVYLQPGSYVLVVILWCWALWSYAPVPRPARAPRLEADYQALLAKTRQTLHVARTLLWRGVRS
jgi:hypothetical protein